MKWKILLTVLVVALFSISMVAAKGGGWEDECDGDKKNACCDGGLTYLEFRYDGDGATVNVTDKDDNVLYPSTVLNESDSFSFTGISGGKMTNDIYVYVNGVEYKIHTSCSKPIYPGLTFGDGDILYVLDGESEKMGPLDGSCMRDCHIPCSAVCKGGITEIVFKYLGTGSVDIEIGSYFDATVSESDPVFTLYNGGSKLEPKNLDFNVSESPIDVGEKDGIALHVSCSDKSVVPGLVFGDSGEFVILSIDSKDGETCPDCGDEIIDPGEECDPPSEGTCDELCQSIPYCGDGVIDDSEDCDDGNNDNGDGCSATCEDEDNHDVPEFSSVGAVIAVLALVGVAVVAVKKK